jgi:hypothetical protein
MVEDRLLDVLADPVGVWIARSGDPVEQAVGAVGLEVAADLVELLAAVADDPAGLADVAELPASSSKVTLRRATFFCVCLIPGFEGAPLPGNLRDALWDGFFTAAPQRQRRSVERYSIVKRA